MKRIKKNLFVIGLFLLSGTTQLFASGAKLPAVVSTETPTLIPPIPTSLTPPILTTASTAFLDGPYIDKIKTLAGDSSCARTSWASRGRAPAGYIKGVTLSFARSLCRMKTKSVLSGIMSAARTSNAAKDALTHYQSTFASLGMPVSLAGEQSLRDLYTLGMGLGMRESSGSYCEGWDRSAGANRSSSAAEAGIFQTSYDSIHASTELSKLYTEYKATPGRCFLSVFKQGVSCGAKNILGKGAGADYQAFNISCPAFATEYAMTMLRIQRGHYGPINRKEAQVIPACNQLLKGVQDLINNDPYACEDII